MNWTPKRLWRPLALLPLVLLLSACPQLDALRPSSFAAKGPTVDDASAVAEILAYSTTLAVLQQQRRDKKAGAADSLRSEYKRLDELAQAPAAVVERVQLAWLLAQPGNRFQDSKRARQLLAQVSEQLSADGGALLDLVNWMDRTVVYSSGLASQLRKAKSGRSVERARRRELEAANTELTSTNGELRSKINALTDIELRIDERTLVP